MSTGYYPAVPFIYSSETKQQETKLDEGGLGVKFNETFQLRSVNFPDIDVQDIVVSPDGKRWFVNDVQPKYFPGTHTTLIHLAQCRVIPNTDSVYNLAVEQQ